MKKKVKRKRFSNYEKKDSRIQWKMVTPATSEKLADAIYKDSRRWAIHNLVLSVIIAAFLFVVSGFLLNTIQNSDILFVGFTPFIAAILFFGFITGKEIIKSIPYLQPEKQEGIWIFRTKCKGTSVDKDFKYDKNYNKEYGDSETYYAYFEKDGEHICISISRSQYKALRRGRQDKEFIFYKLNDRTGNPWRAFCPKLADDKGILSNFRMFFRR